MRTCTFYAEYILLALKIYSEILLTSIHIYIYGSLNYYVTPISIYIYIALIFILYPLFYESHYGGTEIEEQVSLTRVLVKSQHILCTFCHLGKSF